MGRLHLGGVDADLAVGRRAEVSFQLERDAALPDCALLFDAGSFHAELEILERSVGIAEDIAVHQMGHAGDTDPDFSRIDSDNV